MKMLKSVTSSMTNGTASALPVLVFALLVLGAGLAAMAALSGAVTAGAITALRLFHPYLGCLGTG